MRWASSPPRASPSSSTSGFAGPGASATRRTPPKSCCSRRDTGGKRYSFGYPACPRLEDQERLFRLLDAEKRIGVELTEGHMMDPESSVSALVFHHPDAKYFNLSEADAEALEREFAPVR